MPRHAQGIEQRDKKLYALCPMLYSASINNFEIIFAIKYKKITSKRLKLPDEGFEYE